MLTRSLLLQVPGVPLCLESLMPQRDLAVFAGSLQRAGHWTHVADWGSVSGLTLLYAQDNGTQSKGRMPAFMSALLPNRPSQSAHFEAVIDSVAETLGLDFVVLQVPRHEDMAAAATVARGLRQRLPKLSLILTGEHAWRWADYLLEDEGLFAAVVAPDHPASLTVMAETLHTPGQWRHLPGVQTPESVSAGALPPLAPPSVDLQPCYDEEIYPGICREEKLLYFTLRQGPEWVAHHGESLAPTEASAIPPADALCREISAIRLSWPEAHFDLRGASATPFQVEQFCHALDHHRLNVRYSRSLGAGAGYAGLLSFLSASGCRAADLPVWTGSQRLLDEFYGLDASVSALLQTMTAAREEGLPLVAVLGTPCPWDDEHSLEESIRLIREGRPAGLSLRAPIPAPGSTWLLDGAHFGFRTSKRRMAAWAWGLGANRGREAGPDSPARKRGWPQWRVDEALGRMARACERARVQCPSSRHLAFARSIISPDSGTALDGAQLRAFAAGVASSIEAVIDEFNSAATKTSAAARPIARPDLRTAVGN